MLHRHPHKALVLGPNGRLGRAILDNQFAFFWHKLIPIQLDNIEDVDFLAEYKLTKSDIIINCAAYTDVQKSQDDMDKCEMANTILPYMLSIAAQEIPFKLILFSTDYSVRPEFKDNTYTQSKKNMEILCNQNSLIIRMSNLIGEGDKKNTNIGSKLLNNKNEVLTVGDIYIYPTFLDPQTILRLSQIMLSKGRGLVNAFGPAYKLETFARKLLYMHNIKKDIHVNSNIKIEKIKNKHLVFPLSWKALKDVE